MESSYTDFFKNLCMQAKGIIYSNKIGLIVMLSQHSHTNWGSIPANTNLETKTIWLWRIWD